MTTPDDRPFFDLTTLGAVAGLVFLAVLSFAPLLRILDSSPAAVGRQGGGSILIRIPEQTFRCE